MCAGRATPNDPSALQSSPIVVAGVLRIAAAPTPGSGTGDSSPLSPMVNRATPIARAKREPAGPVTDQATVLCDSVRYVDSANAGVVQLVGSAGGGEPCPVNRRTADTTITAMIGILRSVAALRYHSGG